MIVVDVVGTIIDIAYVVQFELAGEQSAAVRSRLEVDTHAGFALTRGCVPGVSETGSHSTPSDDRERRAEAASFLPSDGVRWAQAPGTADS